MFAVPGWSISADLLKRQNDSTNKSDAVPTPSKTSRKRKRRGPAEEEVTSSNLADLWSQHVEGNKPPAKAPKPVKSEQSRKNPEQASQGGKDAAVAAKDAPVDQKQLDRERERAEKRRVKNEKRNAQRAKQKAIKEEQYATATKAASPQPESKAVVKGPPPVPLVPPTTKQEPKLTPLQAAMRQKLISARFRHLNQTLYTAPSSETQTLFDTNPTFFEEYHSGFRQQVSTWPENPVDAFVAELLGRGKLRDSRDRKKRSSNANPATDTSEQDGLQQQQQLGPLPRSNTGTCTIADLGCGDAKLAAQLTNTKAGRKLHLTVLSYDLQAPNPFVTKADIANLPLKDGAVNVAIFCLALMGTNWLDFVDEAWRVLRWKGELWVAEIKSRFARAGGDGAKGANGRKVVEHSVGKRRKVGKVEEKKQKQAQEGAANERLAVEVDGVEETRGTTDVGAFVQVLRKRGFELSGDGAVDLGNKMFVKMRFVKGLSPIKGKNVEEGEAFGEKAGLKRRRPEFVDEEKDDMDEGLVLKPCLYKVR